MDVTFDPAKDARNMRIHNISLRRAEDFDFGAATFDVDDSQDYGEVRWNAVGFLDARLYSLTLPRAKTEIFAPSVFARPQRQKAIDMINEPEEVNDPENPEWTAEKFARAIRFKDLPESLQQILSKPKRGPQKAPTKMLVSMRLSRDVVDGLRATGAGWQGRADEALRAWVREQSKAS